MSDRLDESALLEAFSKAGDPPPSSDQLKRWRRAGLLPRPEVEHLPGVRGSRATYPAWTVGQLAALVRLHRSTRRLQDLVLAIWWEGHWVEPRALREALSSPLERISLEVRVARGEASDPYEAADAIVAVARQEPGPSTSSALLRARLNGPADLMDVLWTLVVLGLGGKAPWEEEDRSLPDDQAPGALRLLSALAGADRAMGDDPLGEGPLVPADFDMPALIGELRDTGAFALEDLAGEIRDATDEELEQAREDALLFFGPLAMICSVLEDLLGEDVAGFGSLRALGDTTATDRAMLIRLMLILRRLVGAEAFMAVAGLVGEVEERYAAIAELRAGLPEHRDLLRLDFDQRLAALPQPEADRVLEDVDLFMDAHPRVAAALREEDDRHGPPPLEGEADPAIRKPSGSTSSAR
jgi:hypothetical protein